jgi:hypothetical protein
MAWSTFGERVCDRWNGHCSTMTGSFVVVIIMVIVTVIYHRRVLLVEPVKTDLYSWHGHHLVKMNLIYGTVIVAQ